MTIDYEYDFGSTTELMITVVNYRIGYEKKEKLTILSRNNPVEIMCEECGEEKAEFVLPGYIYAGYGFLCEKCLDKLGMTDEYFLNVCNSPRMGVCGYEGSKLYPDRFVPDTEREQENKRLPGE